MDLEQIATELGDEFSAFKAAHQDRLDDIEKRMQRMALGGGWTAGSKAFASAEELKALASFIRTGSDAELKAMSVGSDPDGGYTVPTALSEGIITKVWDESPIGRLARRTQIGAGDAYEEPIDNTDIGATWVGETAARPATTTAQLQLLRVPVRELYVLQPVTQRLLDDSRFDIGTWITAKIADKFARAFGRAFVSGDGVLAPRGLLTYPTSLDPDETRPWFTIQHVNTGDASGFIASSTSASPADCLIDMVSALRAPYRRAAVWTMNRATAGIIRKFKDSEGRFVWADAREGQPASLLGYPVEIDEEMPAVSGGNFPIAFGDFGQAYLIAEKPGLRFLRDPFSDKPNTLFYTYARAGGGLQNSEAVKLLRVAVSG